MGSIVVLTGAGISAESGIRTFRDSGGLWEGHHVEDVASPEGFRRNPALVQKFYNDRRRQLKDPAVQPNAAHRALAQLERDWDGDFLLVTQNVDDLHRRAGSRNLLHMHGELRKAWCLTCEARHEWDEDITAEAACPRCKTLGDLRPDIVWFGERPYHMDEIFQALYECEIFISVGTSGKVYPAAGFVRQAPHARKIEANLTASDISDDFDDHRVGPASVEVPRLVAEILKF